MNEFLQPKGFPVLKGDFFPYADKKDHYWAGYFTSRPHLKKLGRILFSRLRAAEFLYSFSLLNGKIISQKLKDPSGIANQEIHIDNRGESRNKKIPKKNLYYELTIARRMSALFLHHDSITGTSSDFATTDYGEKYSFIFLLHSYLTKHYTIEIKPFGKEFYTDKRVITRRVGRGAWGLEPPSSKIF